MSKRHFLLLFCLLNGALASAQGYSLEECRQAARQAGKLDILYEIADADRQPGQRLARSPYQTSAYLYGQTSYQSDSPNPASMTDFPFVLHPLSKYQYHAGVLLRQPIYSGGKRVLDSELDALDRDEERLDLDLQGRQLDAAVDELYLGIILGRKRSEILRSQYNAIDIKLGDARRAFESGLSYKNTVLTLEAQLTGVEAQLAGSEAETAGAERMLATLTGLPVDAATQLTLPAGAGGAASDPGLAKLDLQEQRIALMRKQARAAAMPNLSAFGIVDYGKWQLNFFEDKAALSGMIGLSLVVPITGWRDAEQRGKLLSNAARKLEIQRDEAQRRKEAALQQYDAQIDKYDALEAASRRAAATYEALCEELDGMTRQGVAPASDYLTALEQLAAARLDSEMYSILKLQLQLERERYTTTL